MSLDMVSFEAALKQHYSSDRIENMVYMDNPLLALLPKMEDFGGDLWKLPTIFGNPQNRSANFQQALATDTSANLAAFLITRVKDYSIATVDNETLEASRGNANAFLEAATVQMDGALNALTRSLAIKLYRDGFGSVGQINATVTGTTLTLSNPNEIVNFEVGNTLQFSETLGASLLRDNGEGVLVTKVNRSNGSVTVTPSLSTIAGLAVGDFIFNKGDRQDSATPTRLAVAGLEAWIGAAEPTSALFFGVDRTTDVTRLGGQRLDVTTTPIEEALIEGASVAAREGGKVDHYFMAFSTFSALEKALGTKVQYVDVKMNTEIGFRGIIVNGPRGPIKIIPDQNCPSNRVFGLQLNTWKLGSIGKVVKILTMSDGLTWLRQSDKDGSQIRAGYYANLGCKAPGFNVCLYSTNVTIG